MNVGNDVKPGGIDTKHSLCQNISGDCLNAVLNEFRAVSHDTLPFACLTDTHVGQFHTIEAVQPFFWLDVSQLPSRRQTDEQLSSSSFSVAESATAPASAFDFPASVCSPTGAPESAVAVTSESLSCFFAAFISGKAGTPSSDTAMSRIRDIPYMIWSIASCASFLFFIFFFPFPLILQLISNMEGFLQLFVELVFLLIDRRALQLIGQIQLIVLGECPNRFAHCYCKGDFTTHSLRQRIQPLIAKDPNLTGQLQPLQTNLHAKFTLPPDLIPEQLGHKEMRTQRSESQQSCKVRALLCALHVLLQLYFLSLRVSTLRTVTRTDIHSRKRAFQIFAAIFTSYYKRVVFIDRSPAVCYNV
nr:MAG TPA: hypothetical protein [Caudoviricetes sp.]